MKVYEIQADITKCQLIQRDDHNELHDFRCEKIADKWIDTDWYIYNPLDPKTHFYCSPGATLVFDQYIRESDLGDLLEMSGEVLSVEIDGGKYYFLNIIGCLNALDKTKTTYQYYEDGMKSSVIDQYVFYPQRIGGNPLFKTVETCWFQVLCYEGICDPWDEFKGRYEEMELTGLMFTEIFNSDQPEEAEG